MKTRLPLVGIVDDDVAVRVALTRLCNSHNLSALDFASGHQLFDAILTGTSPDCLVLDVQMPYISGIDIQRWLLHCAPNIPVIMLTGHVDEHTRSLSLSLGAHQFLQKPIHPHDLLCAINDALFANTNVQWWPSSAGQA